MIIWNGPFSDTCWPTYDPQSQVWKRKAGVMSINNGVEYASRDHDILNHTTGISERNWELALNAVATLFFENRKFYQLNLKKKDIAEALGNYPTKRLMVLKLN